MNARERMLAAIHRQPLDRIPTDIWATREVWDKLREHLRLDTAGVRARLRIDGMAGIGPRYIGPPLVAPAADETVDFWELRRRRTPHPGGAYDELVHHPLAFVETLADLERYRWPSADWFDYSTLRAQALAVRDQQVVACGYMAPFYFHNLLRGLEQSLVDPLLDPELTHAIVGRISDFFYDHHRRIFEAADGLIDVAQVTDDLGSQTGPLISLPLYQEFYAPQHRRFMALCREFGITVMHHDDGACRPFIPLLLEMGMGILNPLQWNCPGMALAALKADFGDRLCFHGGLDNQRILPFGTPAEVRAEVHHCLDALASDGTGYILAPCHNLQVVTPVANILAAYDEAHEYGQVVARRRPQGRQSVASPSQRQTSPSSGS